MEERGLTVAEWWESHNAFGKIVIKGLFDKGSSTVEQIHEEWDSKYGDGVHGGTIVSIVKHILAFPSEVQRKSRCYDMSGNCNKLARQAVVHALTGEKRPKDKCGVHVIMAEIEKLYAKIRPELDKAEV